MKKHLLLLITAMFFSIATAFAQGGTTGPLTWNISGNTLTISGNGAMLDYSYGEAPWFEYQESIHTGIIEIGVTSIGDYAFSYCNNLSSITIPNSVTKIGDWAFRGCENLSSITIPNNVSTIGEWAFGDCKTLTSIIIPNSVTSIGTSAFSHCINMSSISLPNGITTLGNHAFSNCKSIISITLPNSITSTGNGVFSYCTSLSLITIPNGVAMIGHSVFTGCTSLNTITIPSSVTSIWNNSFSYCTNLTSIYVESENNSYTSENGVLFNKSKTTIVSYPAGKTGAYVIPNTVTSIGSEAFEGCSNLTSVTIPQSVANITYRSFQDCTNLTSVTISNGVTNISGLAFAGCTNLASITIPNSVTTIEYGAFERCSSLTSIDVESGNNNYSSENGVLFNKNKTTLISYPAGKTGTYAIPNTVTSIERGAFNYCTGLTSITIPNSLTSIEEWSFMSCTSLTSVIISSSITSIGDYAFHFCTSLTSITNHNPIPITINSSVFSTVDQSVCTLKVPIGSVSAYQNAAVWKEFNIGNYLVSVTHNGYGNVTGNGIYEANSTAIVTATAQEGYRFVNWTKNDVEISTNNPYNFIVTEDVELVANFEEGVGIAEKRLIKSVQVYPNPTTSILKIESGELKIQNVVVYDIFGKIQKIENWKTENTINISHLPAGIYFVKISTENGEVTRKVVKR